MPLSLVLQVQMLDKLPPELLPSLVRHLDVPSFLHLASTSRTWRARSEAEDGILWRAIGEQAGYDRLQTAGDDGLYEVEAQADSALRLAVSRRRTAVRNPRIDTWKSLGARSSVDLLVSMSLLMRTHSQSLMAGRAKLATEQVHRQEDRSTWTEWRMAFQVRSALSSLAYSRRRTGSTRATHCSPPAAAFPVKSAYKMSAGSLTSPGKRLTAPTSSSPILASSPPNRAPRSRSGDFRASWRTRATFTKRCHRSCCRQEDAAIATRRDTRTSLPLDTPRGGSTFSISTRRSSKRKSPFEMTLIAAAGWCVTPVDRRRSL